MKWLLGSDADHTNQTHEVVRVHVWYHLQACGDWEQALHVAEQSDRINLKATHCSYAHLHEANGNVEAAIKHHQLADTHR